MFQGIWHNKIVTLIVLSIVVITVSTFFKAAVELEDAEQAYYSQWFRWGYDDQPPLYTWIQYLFNQVLGTTKISFSFLRALIFGSILFMLFEFSKKYAKDVKIATLTVLASGLVPVFIDFTFRRLSHTSLLCLSVLVTYFIIEKLLSKRTVWRYFLFGVCIAFGLLSKYNYVLFMAAFGLTCLLDNRLKDIVLDIRIFLSIAVVALLILPHLYWLLGPGENLMVIQEGVRSKLGTRYGHNFLWPIALTLKELFVFIAPLALVLAVFVFKKDVVLFPQKWNWLSKLFAAQILILFLFFVFIEADKIEARWLLPLLLPFMVLLMLSLKFKYINGFIKYGFVTFMGIIVMQFLRTPVERIFGIPSSVHFGFEPISNILRNEYPEHHWVLPDVTYAGNIKLLNPNRTIFSSDDFSLNPDKNDQDKVLVFRGMVPNGANDPTDTIFGFGMERDTLYFVRQSDAIKFKK